VAGEGGDELPLGGKGDEGVGEVFAGDEDAVGRGEEGDRFEEFAAVVAGLGDRGAEGAEVAVEAALGGEGVEEVTGFVATGEGGDGDDAVAAVGEAADVGDAAAAEEGRAAVAEGAVGLAVGVEADQGAAFAGAMAQVASRQDDVAAAVDRDRRGPLPFLRGWGLATATPPSPKARSTLPFGCRRRTAGQASARG
jgi:hypothetical protein